MLCSEEYVNEPKEVLQTDFDFTGAIGEEGFYED